MTTIGIPSVTDCARQRGRDSGRGSPNSSISVAVFEGSSMRSMDASESWYFARSACQWVRRSARIWRICSGVLPALRGTVPPSEDDSVGILETLTAASAIVAADVAARFEVLEERSGNEGSTFRVWLPPERARTAQALPSLPADVRNFGVSVKKSLAFPLLIISLISPNGTYDGNFLGNYATININDALKRIPGVVEHGLDQHVAHAR